MPAERFAPDTRFRFRGYVLTIVFCETPSQTLVKPTRSGRSFHVAEGIGNDLVLVWAAIASGCYCAVRRMPPAAPWRVDVASGEVCW